MLLGIFRKQQPFPVTPPYMSTWGESLPISTICLCSAVYAVKIRFKQHYCGTGGRPKPELCFLLGQLRWTLLPKENALSHSVIEQPTFRMRGRRFTTEQLPPRVFVQHSDIVNYFLIIVIFYCANATAFHMPDWKFRKGVVRLNWFAK